MSEINTENQENVAAAEMLEHHKRKLEQYKDLVAKTKNVDFLPEYRRAMQFHRTAIDNHGKLYKSHEK